MEGCEDHERVPGRHKPLWRKRLEDAEKEKAETRKKFREASEVNKEETIEAVAVESENGIEYVNPQTGEAISMDASYETEDYSDQAFEYEPDA